MSKFTPSPFLTRLRIFSLQCGPSGSTRKIVDEAIEHIQELEMGVEQAEDVYEALADIAWAAGHAHYHAGDSRADVVSFIEWAKEFTALHVNTDWSVADPGYMELIWEFAQGKMGLVTKSDTMTGEQAKALGYEMIVASHIEFGLVKNGQGIRTWWARSFEHVLPALSHPRVLEAVRINEENTPK